MKSRKLTDRKTKETKERRSAASDNKCPTRELGGEGQRDCPEMQEDTNLQIKRACDLPGEDDRDSLRMEPRRPCEELSRQSRWGLLSCSGVQGVPPGTFSRASVGDWKMASVVFLKKCTTGSEPVTVTSNLH